jgi:hypothetical protein
MSQATEDDKFLVTFFWAVQERPRRPADVFLRPERTPRPDAQAVSAASAEEEEEDEEDGEYTNSSSRKRNRK